MTKQRCQGKRRYQRGCEFGLFPCMRLARFTFQTYVGLTRSHYVCADPECMGSITNGYGANNIRELGK